MKTSDTPPRYDVVFIHCRRETIILLCTFAFFLIWSLGVSFSLGYEQPTDSPETVVGIPRWVFWGVAVPWMAGNVFTILFAAFYVKDDPLEDELVDGSVGQDA